VKTATHVLKTTDGDMELYEAVPDSPPAQAVIVIQEAFGVNDHIRDVTRRFADAGYHAVAPALFHRAGGGVAEYGDMESVVKLFEGFTDDGVLVDVDATRDHLAAVGFYGGGIVEAGRFPLPALIEEAGLLQTPWLGLFGDLDAAIPVDHVERLRETLDATAPVDHAIVRYPDAGHGFHCDARDAYHAESAADGWSRTLDWFRGHLA